MTIEVTCPACGCTNGFNANADFGQSVCTRCGHVLGTRSTATKGSVRTKDVGERFSLAPFAVMATMVGVLACLVFWPLLGAFDWDRSKPDKVVCANNLKLIGLALQSYADQHGMFPPAYMADSAGRPMHSWRVLILPQLEEEELYQRYDFQQPWNSSHNLALVALMPDIYQCPSVDYGGRGMTSYRAATGPDSLFAGKRIRAPSDMSEVEAQMPAVVEMSDAPLLWLDPRDGEQPKLAKHADKERGHRNGNNVLAADGSVRFVNDATLDDAP